MAAPQRPAAGPVARNSVSYKIHIRRRIKPIALAPALPRPALLFDYPIKPDPLILFHHQIARIIDIQ